MEQINEELFQYAFELYGSTIESMELNDKNLVIYFGSIHIHKYFGKIDFGIEESSTTTAEMILRDAIIHGDEPQYPGNIADVSFVEDGSIYGSYIDYPFSTKGDLQLVITFSSHEKIIIRSSKAFMLIKDLDSKKSHIQ